MINIKVGIKIMESLCDEGTRVAVPNRLEKVKYAELLALYDWKGHQGIRDYDNRSDYNSASISNLYGYNNIPNVKNQMTVDELAKILNRELGEIEFWLNAKKHSYI